MKNTFLLIFSIVAVTNNLSAQNPLVKQWDKRFGGTSIDNVFDLVQTSDSGFVLCGYSLSAISGDKTQLPQGDYDFWILKTDGYGNKILDKRFGGYGADMMYQISLTNDGGYLLAGNSKSTVSGDKTESNRDATNNTYDYWILKLDAAFNKVWDKRFGGDKEEDLFSCSTTADGGFMLGGYSHSGANGDKSQDNWGGVSDFDFWVLKTDSSGSKLWDKHYGGIYADELTSLLETNDKGFLFGGWSSSGISGDKTQPSWGSEDYWIIKTDSMGAKQWDKRFGGNEIDKLQSITKTYDGGYVLGGYSRSGVSGDKTQPLWGSQFGDLDYWILKIDASGNKIWDKSFGGTDWDVLYKVIETSDKGFLLTGWSRSAVSGDKTESNLSNEQVWMVKTDSLGNKLWDKTIQTITTNTERYNIPLEINNNYYIALSTVADGGGDKTQASQGSYDYWIINFRDSTGNTSLKPFSNFCASQNHFCANGCVDFYDQSIFSPTSWQWFFPGAVPSSSTIQNPQNICYTTDGLYDVILISCNGYGCDTISYHNFIEKYPTPINTIYLSNDTLWSQPALDYQWYGSGGAIQGATLQYFKVTNFGFYYCVVVNANGCSVSSNVIIASVPEKNNDDVFTIQPNPFASMVTISFPRINFKQATIIIRDMIGTTVLQSTTLKQQTTIDLSFLSKGIYMIEVVADDKRMVRKMVKE